MSDDNLYWYLLGRGGFVKRPYGTLFRPTDYGSSGCPGKSSGGKAGGIIFINVGDELYLDGVFQSNGQNADRSSSAGGGSGGSIWITTGRFSGHGSMSTNGGNGDGASSGGGSGGRIALLNKHTENMFRGTYSSLGGDAGDINQVKTKFSGGPGTVYVDDIRNGQVYSKLLIDNKNRPWDHYLTLNENIKSYIFDEVSLVRNASLHMIPDGTSMNLTIHKVVGDRTGFIHMHKSQLLKAEYKPTSFTLTR